MTLREQKILTAIKYFTKNTKHLGRTKLFKLFFFWDFRYFSKHGKTITGFTYLTYPFGPVPQELFEMVINDEFPCGFKDQFFIEEDKNEDTEDNFKRFKVILRDKNIDLDCLTGYEKEALLEVAEIFEDCTANDIVESSHLSNTPWKKTKEEKGMFKEIDYFLEYSPSSNLDRTEVEERFLLQRALTHNGFN